MINARYAPGLHGADAQMKAFEEVVDVSMRLGGQRPPRTVGVHGRQEFIAPRFDCILAQQPRNVPVRIELQRTVLERQVLYGREHDGVWRNRPKRHTLEKSLR